MNLKVFLMLIIFNLLVSCSGGGNSSLKNEEKQIVPVILNISPEEAYSKILSNSNNPLFFIIDVRTSSEYAEGHIEKSTNIDYKSASFSTEINSFNKSNAYIIYCLSGGRSGSALKKMRASGFLEVYNITGGITSWTTDSLPVIK